MAVKPLVQPEIWASNALYTTGPFIGSASKVVPGAGIAAEGHRPGALFPTPAEYENSQQNRITGLCQWVFAGSSAGAADAHVLESDVNGEGQVERWRVVPANPNSYALFVQAPPGAGFAVQATGGSALGDATIIGVTTGPGAALEGVSGTAGACVNAVPSGAGHGFTCTVGGTGKGIEIVGGSGDTAIEATAGPGQIAGDFIADATSVHALRGIGGTLRAVYGVGIGGGRGGEFLAGNTATSAMLATGVDPDAVGVHGRTSTSASATASGVYGQARGTGTSGVHGDGGTVGRGIIAQADASTPAYSAMRIIPQDADPTSATSDGEVIWHGNHKTLRTCVAGYGYRSMPTMGPGSAMIVNATIATETEDAIAGGGIYSTGVLTAICDTTNGTGFYGVAAGAEVLITVTCDVRTSTGATNTINLRLHDVTDGTDIAEFVGAGNAGNNGFFLSYAGTEWQRSIVCNVRYIVPNDGDLTVRLDMGATGAAAAVRNVALTIVGTF